MFGLSPNITCQFCSYCQLVLIRQAQLMILLERKKNSLKKYPWVRARKNLPEKPSSQACNLVTGLYFKTVNSVSSSWRKSNNLSSHLAIQKLQSPIKTSDSGSLANHIASSLLVCYKKSSRLPTSHQKVSRQVFTRLSLLWSIKSSYKRSTIQTGRT